MSINEFFYVLLNLPFIFLGFRCVYRFEKIMFFERKHSRNEKNIIASRRYKKEVLNK